VAGILGAAAPPAALVPSWNPPKSTDRMISRAIRAISHSRQPISRRLGRLPLPEGLAYRLTICLLQPAPMCGQHSNPGFLPGH
jgi:hypothetical protein